MLLLLLALQSWPFPASSFNLVDELELLLDLLLADYLELLDLRLLLLHLEPFDIYVQLLSTNCVLRHVLVIKLTFFMLLVLSIQ